MSAASLLHAGQDVLVGLDREGDVGVAEPFADDLDGDAFLDEQAAVGVAEVVEPDRGTPALCTIRLERSA